MPFDGVLIAGGEREIYTTGWQRCYCRPASAAAAAAAAAAAGCMARNHSNVCRSISASLLQRLPDSELTRQQYGAVMYPLNLSRRLACLRSRSIQQKPHKKSRRVVPGFWKLRQLDRPVFLAFLACCSCRNTFTATTDAYILALRQ